MRNTSHLLHSDFLQADRDGSKAAKAIKLAYVKDSIPGITRIKKGKKFAYVMKDKPVKDKKIIDRINKLVIPPAWQNVWICNDPSGHIQATGTDLRNRKQYIYHPEWKALRTETKFHRLYEFGKVLPQLRTRIEKDIASKDMAESKVLATLIAVMDRTYIRIGNNGYEKLYGSYGLTTLKDQHVTINGDKLRFSFIGKKGIEQDITISNRRLARTVKQCRDIPGKKLFQYYTDGGERKPVDSGMVNNYIHEASGKEFSAKDFRTWAGTLHALQCLCSAPEAATESARKKNIVGVLDAVSSKLGNSRAICKKYYVHPCLLKLYEDKKLEQTVAKFKHNTKSANKNFNNSEKLLMRILNDSIRKK